MDVKEANAIALHNIVDLYKLVGSVDELKKLHQVFEHEFKRVHQSMIVPKKKRDREDLNTLADFLMQAVDDKNELNALNWVNLILVRDAFF